MKEGGAAGLLNEGGGAAGLLNEGGGAAGLLNEGGGEQQASCLVAKQDTSLHNNTPTLYHVGLHELIRATQ